MKAGDNTIHIACKLELINAIKKFSGELDQNNGFWLMKRAVECVPELKEQLIKKYGKKKYQEILNHYSKTNLEQREEKKVEEEIKKVRKEAREKIKQIKAEAYKDQTDLAKAKRKDKVEKEFGSLQRLKDKRERLLNAQARVPEGTENWKNYKKQLDEVNEKIEKLERSES